MNFEDMQGLMPFPFVAKKIGTADYELVDPINDMLERAIKMRMSELMTMGMLFAELSKIFPSFAVKPPHELNFEQESEELRKWTEQGLKNIPPEIKSLYFTSGEDEICEEEDLKTYSIALLAADSYDEDFDWICNAKQLSEKNFQSKTLDGFFRFKPGLLSLDSIDMSLDQILGRIAFWEDILLYGYGLLLTVKACRAIKDKELYGRLQKLNVFYGTLMDNEFISHRSIGLRSLLDNQ